MLGDFPLKKCTLIRSWFHLQFYTVSRYFPLMHCPSMKGILRSFWLGILETFKCVGHIYWHRYINITFFVIPFNCQSRVVVTLLVGQYCVVIIKKVDEMIRIIFTKIIYIKIFHTSTIKKNLFDVLLVLS